MTDKPTQFRANCDGNVWFVEFENDGDWFDVFENPSEEICKIVANTLNEFNIHIVDVTDSTPPPPPKHLPTKFHLQSLKKQLDVGFGDFPSHFGQYCHRVEEFSCTA